MTTTGTCTTGKTCWPSRSAANASRGARRNKGHRMRAYLCPFCHAWHLTSRAHDRDLIR